MTDHGLLDASTDPTVIAAWWTRWPDANIGLRTGIAFDVLDLDGAAGLASLQRFAPGYKHQGPVNSTGRGFHLLFQVTNAKNGAHLGSPNKKTDPTNVDFRGQNGYIVAPPSIHPSGSVYTWVREPDEDLPEAPYWLLELVFPPAPRSNPAPTSKTLSLAVGLLDLEQEFAAMGVQFRPAGSRRVGLCPFHDEGTPSLVLYPNETFYCFGCNEWGDALNVRNYSTTGRLR